MKRETQGQLARKIASALNSKRVANKQTNKQTNKHTNKQTIKQQSNKHVFAGQAEAIVRSAAAATTFQDEDFADDLVFNELACAGGSGSTVGALGRGNPGWSSSQCSSLA